MYIFVFVGPFTTNSTVHRKIHYYVGFPLRNTMYYNTIYARSFLYDFVYDPIDFKQIVCWSVRFRVYRDLNELYSGYKRS